MEKQIENNNMLLKKQWRKGIMIEASPIDMVQVQMDSLNVK